MAITDTSQDSSPCDPRGPKDDDRVAGGTLGRIDPLGVIVGHPRGSDAVQDDDVVACDGGAPCEGGHQVGFFLGSSKNLMNFEIPPVRDARQALQSINGIMQKRY